MESAKQLKIILIEDSVSDAKLTQYALSRLSPSPELIHFENGETFFEFIENTDIGGSSIVLLDLNLPRMSGLDILQALRNQKHFHPIPVVIFSSSKEVLDVQSCYEHGANAYVQKPLTLEDFDSAIEAIVNFWSYANVVPGPAGVFGGNRLG